MTPAHVPHCFHQREYEVLYTQTLQLRGTQYAAALPVNLIRIRAFRDLRESKDAPRLVCGSFDMTLCCVALANINEDISFQPCLSYNNAF